MEEEITFNGLHTLRHSTTFAESLAALELYCDMIDKDPSGHSDTADAMCEWEKWLLFNILMVNRNIPKNINEYLIPLRRWNMEYEWKYDFVTESGYPCEKKFV